MAFSNVASVKDTGVLEGPAASLGHPDVGRDGPQAGGRGQVERLAEQLFTNQ